MLFNTNVNEAASVQIDYDAVEPSKYEVGLEGALMHVYETQLNYNAMMKATALSELRYFKETGGDLFVNEASAVGGFIEKAKRFFKAVIDKIIAIFKKFAMLISSYVSDDKTFVRKYKAAILLKQSDLDRGGFEFKGYDFSNLDTAVNKISTNAETLTGNTISSTTTAEQRDKDRGGIDHTYSSQGKMYNTTDKEDTEIEKERGNMLGGKGELTESEFKDELKDMLYKNDGKKDVLEKINLATQISIISETRTNIKTVEATQKKIIDALKKFIKALENIQSSLIKEIDTKNADEKNAVLKGVNWKIRLAKSQSDNYTTAFGMIVGAYKDRNRQAKAICVKAINYKPKNESAGYWTENSTVDDYFGDVVFK